MLHQSEILQYRTKLLFTAHTSAANFVLVPKVLLSPLPSLPLLPLPLLPLPLLPPLPPLLMSLLLSLSLPIIFVLVKFGKQSDILLLTAQTTCTAEYNDFNPLNATT